MRAALPLVLLLLSGAPARAQEASTGIVADRLRPGLGPATLAAAEGAETMSAGRLSTMLALGYLRDPVVLRARADGALVAVPVRQQLTGSFGWEVGLPRGFALRASLPVVLVNDGDRLRGTGVGGSGNDAGPTLKAGAGDLMFGAKVALIGAPTQPGMHAAVALEVTVPLGGENDFAATDGVAVSPRVMIDFRLPFLSLVLDGQVRFMPERRLFGSRFGDELILTGGVIARLASFGGARRWHLVGYVEGTGVLTGEAAARPGELRTALRLAHAGVEFDLGGGAGLVDAVGSPRFRVFALLRLPLGPSR